MLSNIDSGNNLTTLYDLMSAQATQRPENLALASSSLEMTFSELKTAVDSVATKLASLGVGAQQLVLIELPEFYNWIVTLAVAKIGAVSLSIPEGAETNQFAELIDFRVSADNVQTSNELLFETSWLSRRAEETSSPTYQFLDSDFVRAIATSGSTGVPKLAMFTQKSMVARIQRIPMVWFSASTEFNFMPLGATGGFGSAIYSLISGLPFLVRDTSRKSLVDFLARNNVQTITGSPEQIAVFVTNNSDHLYLLDSLKTIRLAGASPSRVFIETIKQAFGAEIVSVYGSTETGSIFTNQHLGPDEAGLLGLLSPGSEVRIVDDSGLEIQDGREGFLETRSETIFSGYLKSSNPLTLEDAPRWFATTDKVVNTNGVYRFISRDSNVLNIGGIKIEVDQLENFAKMQEGVLDAVSFVGENRSGRALHVMAIVVVSERAKTHLIQAINERFAEKAPGVFWRVSEIPRAGLDKPARWLLADRFQSEYRD